jgi:hypothetical protein
MVKEKLPLFGYGWATTVGARGRSPRVGSSMLADVLGRQPYLDKGPSHLIAFADFPRAC